MIRREAKFFYGENNRVSKPIINSHKVFEVFDGKEVRVKLECRNDLVKYVIDRFGMTFDIEPATEDTTYCYVDARLRWT